VKKHVSVRSLVSRPEIGTTAVLADGQSFEMARTGASDPLP
jgi:hypothetical protein